MTAGLTYSDGERAVTTTGPMLTIRGVPVGIWMPTTLTEISFITLKRSSGHKAYVRTAILVMVKAIDDVLDHDKTKQVKVEFAIGNGYYISPKGGLKVDQEFIDKLLKVCSIIQNKYKRS